MILSAAMMRRFGEKVMQEKTVVSEMVSWTLFALVIAMVGLAMGGCTSNTGWGFQVGVFPVSQVRNVQSLQGNQRTTIDVARKPATKSQNVEEDY